MTDQELRARQISSTLADYVNALNYKKDYLVEAITSEHRTLQQRIMNVMIDCIEKWAGMYDDRDYDGRNEAACRLAAKIMNTIKDDKYLPYI